MPHLNQHFSNKLFVAQEEEKDYARLVDALPQQTSDFRARFARLETGKGDAGGISDAQSGEVKRLQAEIDELSTEAEQSVNVASRDPDQAKRAVERSRHVRLRLAKLEQSLGVDAHATSRLAEAISASEGATAVVERFGSAFEKKELQMLAKQFERTLAKADEDSLEKIRDTFDALRWRVLFAQDWWWREIFESMQAEGHVFLNRAEAERLVEEGQAAIRVADGTRLRAIVRELWKLQPKDEMERDRERAMRSGLRTY